MSDPGALREETALRALILPCWAGCRSRCDSGTSRESEVLSGNRPRY